MGNKAEQRDMPNAGAEVKSARSLRAAAEKKLPQMPPADNPARPVEEILHKL